MNGMTTLAYIFIAVFLGSIASLIGGVLLMTREGMSRRIAHFLAAFAAGIFLGAAFLDLLPEALHEAESTGVNVLAWTLFGIVFFFLIERFIHWFHHHGQEHYSHEKEGSSIIPLIIVGDTVHNFVDGMAIAATFMTDISLGIVTTMAVMAHEIPQEIADFGLLLHKGMSRKLVIVVNILSASTAVAGALFVYLLGATFEGYTPVFLAITAGFFVYIATSDLIPEIHYEKNTLHAFIKASLLVAGILIIWLSTSLLERS